VYSRGQQHLRWTSKIALLAVSAAGLLAFALPFLLAAVASGVRSSAARPIDASLLLAVVAGGSILIALAELVRGPQAGSLSRSLALLGILVAIDATIRLAPSFLGASPIFALILVVGYVFGPRFGFMMGALTLLLSAAVTAGIGPWLPFQMLGAGWTGMAAGWLPHPRRESRQILALAAFGAGAGFAYGALLNLYAWPYAAPGMATDVGLYWNPALTLRESIARYAAFYLATSLVHDATRAIANALLILVAGGPALRLLARFRARSAWSAADDGWLGGVPSDRSMQAVTDRR
jgi:energy-coupling factor transport system substrate-specific component